MPSNLVQQSPAIVESSILANNNFTFGLVTVKKSLFTPAVQAKGGRRGGIKGLEIPMPSVRSKPHSRESFSKIRVEIISSKLTLNSTSRHR